MDETLVWIHSESIWICDKLADAFLIGVQVDEIFPVQDLANAEKGDDALINLGCAEDCFQCWFEFWCIRKFFCRELRKLGLDFSSCVAAALLCPAAVPDILRMKRGEWTTSERSSKVKKESCLKPAR